jgi:hypothetical protein
MSSLRHVSVTCVGHIAIADCGKSNFTHLFCNNTYFMFHKSVANVSKLSVGLFK